LCAPNRPPLSLFYSTIRTRGRRHSAPNPRLNADSNPEDAIREPALPAKKPKKAVDRRSRLDMIAVPFERPADAGHGGFNGLKQPVLN
jgi:hypothetical protein